MLRACTQHRPPVLALALRPSSRLPLSLAPRRSVASTMPARNPVPLSDIPTLTEDYASGDLEGPEEGKALHGGDDGLNGRVSLYRGDVRRFNQLGSTRQADDRGARSRSSRLMPS